MSDVIPEVTTEMLQAFAEAWNRHDVDALIWASTSPFRVRRHLGQLSTAATVSRCPQPGVQSRGSGVPVVIEQNQGLTISEF